jgi:Na+-transporting methylmalonyl-CoA/oxaloacetate decarboxylase gamma subunit
MAEIKIERKQRSSLMPWLLALALLVLVIWGVARVMDRQHSAAADPRHGAAAADSIQDSTPPRLRQYAALPALRDAA